MNIVFLAAECAPFAKVGGLGDVIGSLPESLVQLGHSVRVILPHHGVIDDTVFGMQAFDEFSFRWNQSVTRVKVASVERLGVMHYFIRGWPYFAAHETFVYHADAGIDVGRYLFLAASSLELVRRIARREHWRPDIFHAHDWHAGSLPYLLHRVYPDDPLTGQAASVFSIHNMQYQGWGVGWHLRRAGLPRVDHPLLVAAGKTDSTLALGLAFCSVPGTVSPTYGKEIATPAGGHGLDGLVHARSKHLIGVLNGIDTERWNPATSETLATPFDAETATLRTKNKGALQKELGLPKCAKTLVAGTVMRLVDQKGAAILFPAVRRLLDDTNCQFALLGAGQPEHEAAASAIATDYPTKSAIRIGFDEPLSERMYGGLDLFLMPSEFEPCGIGQMIAMRYGALPLVTKVGGLADTVDTSTGFVMDSFSVAALERALAIATEVYDHDRQSWARRQQAAMRHDFGWRQSAQAYVRAYQTAIQLHHHYH